jgi:hypothetical protein
MKPSNYERNARLKNLCQIWYRREESNLRHHPYQRVPVQLSLGKFLIVNDIIIKFFSQSILRLECTQEIK